MIRALFIFSILLLTTGCSSNDDATEITGTSSNNPTVFEPDIKNPEEITSNPAPSTVSLNQISTNFRTFIKDKGIIGAQVAITRNEKLVFLESFGDANRENGNAVTDNTLFRIASISKPITLLAISKLVDEGKLNPTARVFGPESLLGLTYGQLPYEPEELLITLDDLVEHRAGFSDKPFDVMFNNNTLTLDALIGKVLDERSLNSTPGTFYEYSNFGYALLGKIIENVSGTAYDNYIRNAILSPIDVNDMFIANNEKQERYPNEAVYYSNWKSPYEINMPRLGASAGWVSSAKSLAWIAVKSDGRFAVNDILKPNTGISYLRSGNWTHNGSLPGTMAVMKVGHPFSYVVLTNSGGANFAFVIDALHAFMENAIEQQSAWPNTDLFQPNK